MNFIIIKCRKCRHTLLNETKTPLLSGHNIKVDKEYLVRQSTSADCSETQNSLFLEEQGLPDWIVDVVNEAGWLKGKLHCPNCSLRLGSFNFISGRKCSCGECIVPPLHIIKSKVDWSLQEIS